MDAGPASLRFTFQIRRRIIRAFASLSGFFRPYLTRNEMLSITAVYVSGGNQHLERWLRTKILPSMQKLLCIQEKGRKEKRVMRFFPAAKNTQPLVIIRMELIANPYRVRETVRTYKVQGTYPSYPPEETEPPFWTSGGLRPPGLPCRSHRHNHKSMTVVNQNAVQGLHSSP